MVRKIRGTNGDDVFNEVRDRKAIILGRNGDDSIYSMNRGDVLKGGNGEDGIYVYHDDVRIVPGSSNGYDGVRTTAVDTILDLGETKSGVVHVNAPLYGDWNARYDKVQMSVTVKLTKSGGTIEYDHHRTYDGVRLNDSGVMTIRNLKNLNVAGPIEEGVYAAPSMIIGGADGDDVFRINAANKTKVFTWGGAGDDLHVGAGGINFIYFQVDSNDPSAGVTVNIRSSKNGQMSGVADDAFGGKDTFRKMEVVQGSNGDDLIKGSRGDDTVRDMLGSDKVVGGRGEDLIIYDRGDMDGLKVDLAKGRAVSTYDGGGRDVDRLKGIENVWGSRTCDDVLKGDGKANELRGRGGDDVLNGRGGKDAIYAGAGEDLLTGGRGADRFIFERGDGKANRITDFELGRDDIVIRSGARDMSDLTISGKAGGTEIAFANVAVFLEDVEGESLRPTDFIFA